jgi:hypothetical protein
MQPPSARAVDSLSPIECYHILRDQVEHEDSLTTQRLSWLLAAQSFLFTAYAIVLNGPGEAASRFVAAQRSWLLTAIPALGLSSAVLIYVSIVAGVVALFGLHRRARAVCESCVEGASFPPVQGTPFTRITGLASPLLVPPIFALVWLCLMLHGLAR